MFDIGISLVSVKSLLSACFFASYRLKIDGIFTEILLFKVGLFYNNFIHTCNIL